MITWLVLTLLASDAGAHAGSLPERYIACLEGIEADQEKGRRAAQRWVDEGGGANAMHCLAIADMSGGFHKLAAVRLEAIAERKDAGDDIARARLYDQAATAWLAAKKPVEARRALDSGLVLAPDLGRLRLTDAAIHTFDENWSGVVQAINAAEKARVLTTTGLVLRGEARLKLGDTDGAASDVMKVLSLDPSNIDALTLRGEVQQAGVYLEPFFE